MPANAIALKVSTSTHFGFQSGQNLVAALLVCHVSELDPMQVDQRREPVEPSVRGCRAHGRATRVGPPCIGDAFLDFSGR
jgi:hypothetical protein